MVPSYPLLARQARIQGTVRLHFDVTQDGTASNVVNDLGHPILFAGVESSLREARFDTRCEGTLNMIYTFAFSDNVGNATTVKFNAPNQYVVTADVGGIICILYSTTKPRHLLRRFLSLFH
jgi:hypothetical protein